MRQMISVIISLLKKTQFGILFCIRMIINMTMIAQYHSHIETTMNYIQHYLNVFNIVKEALRLFQKKRSFNISKMHSLTHYSHFIREYDALTNFSIEIEEATHSNHLKTLWRLFNKRENYEKQMLQNNTRRTNVLTVDDYDLWKQDRANDHVEIQKIDLMNKSKNKRQTRMTKCKNMKQLEWIIDRDEQRVIKRLKCSSRNWCYASTAATQTQISCLLETLALFIRKERAKQDCFESYQEFSYSKEKNVSWIKHYPVQVHEKLTTWFKLDINDHDMNRLTAHTCRATFNWQKREKRRCDYVWIQKWKSKTIDKKNNRRFWKKKLINYNLY